jgi:hypothetical protein
MCRSLLTLVGFALLAALPSHAQTPRKLKETDVLKLIEYQIRDDAIIERIDKSGVDFQVTDATLERFRRAGASDDLLAALRGKSADAQLALKASPGSLMLWVQQEYSRDCPLHSELFINGTPIDVFSSNTQKSLGDRLKPGWNTIRLNTAVKGPEAEWNELNFRLGYVQKDERSKKQVMECLLWNFDNGTGWKHADGRFTHLLGPDVREVTQEFKLFFAGPELEKAKPKAGDYILTANQSYGRNPPVTITVFINNKPLTSFLGRERTQLVISPLLEPGNNVVRIVANRFSNVVEWNDFEFSIGGPAEYSVTESKYVVTPVLEFKGITGWSQDKKTGTWKRDDAPDSDSFERTLPFNLEKAPNK